MLTVTDRTEPARGFRPQSLPAQAGRHVFYVIHPSLSKRLIRQAGHTIALFCVTECFPDDVIADKAELNDAGLSDDDADARCTNRYGQPEIHGGEF
ncbi:hypothetical protein SEA27A368_39780 [Salmonella enterica]|nr:hypothetical protein SEA27A368_39780 [Salmonella enterica]